MNTRSSLALRWRAATAMISFFLAAATLVGSETTTDTPLERLAAGNARFASGRPEHPHSSVERRGELAGAQAPFAVVLACADSRVAPELVFDQGLGDLFVVRVAGNVLDNTGLGSIEYAVEHLHASLIVVLGHERCGAVTAAVQGTPAPGHIHSFVQAIEPAVRSARAQPGDPVDNTVRANVRRVVTQLEHAEPLLPELLHAGKLQAVGAYYDLDTGHVEFLR